MAGTNFFTPISATCWVGLTEAEGQTSGGQLAMFAKCTGAPPTTAGVFAHGCLMNRTDSGTGSNALSQNTGSSAVPVWTTLDTSLGGPATSLVDSNGVVAFDVGTTASAVNGLRVTDSATGSVSANFVLLTTQGTDAAISISINPKGDTAKLSIGGQTQTGTITLGTSSNTQEVDVGNGTGATTVKIADRSTLSNTVEAASTATGAGLTDTVTLAAGNAAATGVKVVNILTGTPGTSGNNRMTMGGGSTTKVTTNATATEYLVPNFCAGSAVANAPVTTLTDASGANVTLQGGLRITLLLTAALQAGANTLTFNTVSKSIKSHLNPANDIGTVYASGGLVLLAYDGTQWQDMSQ